MDERDSHGTRVEVEVPQVDAREGVDGLCGGDGVDGGTVRVEERLGVVGGVRAFGVILVAGVVGLEGAEIPKIDGFR